MAQRYRNQCQQQRGERPGQAPLGFRDIFRRVGIEQVRSRLGLAPVADAYLRVFVKPDQPFVAHHLVFRGIALQPVQQSVVEGYPQPAVLQALVLPGADRRGDLTHLPLARIVEYPGHLAVRLVLAGNVNHRAGVFVAVEASRLEAVGIQVGLGPGIQYVTVLVGPGTAVQGQRADCQGNRYGNHHHRTDDAFIAGAGGVQGHYFPVPVQPAQADNHRRVKGNRDQDLQGNERLQEDQLDHEVDAQRLRHGFGQVSRATETGKQGNEYD